MKKIKGLLIVIIFILGYLGYQYPIQFDLTQTRINSLSESSIELLSTINQPLYLELFTTDRAIENRVLSMVELFQRENKAINFKVHHTTMDPQEKTQYFLQTNHNLVGGYGDQKKAIDVSLAKWNEELLINFIYRILQAKEQWVVFLSGHGEADPFSQENRGFSTLTTVLKEQGVSMAVLNLGTVGIIPGNTKLLVIADSKIAWLPEESLQISNYIKNGGNLLWLINPNSKENAKELIKCLGVEVLPDTIFDPHSHRLGTPDPAISIISQYPSHVLTEHLEMLTVFPWATGLQFKEAVKLGWSVVPFLTTNSSTFVGEGKNKSAGPFTIGLLLQQGKQRVGVIGNSYFLSNSTLHNYGNLALAKRIFGWLTETSIATLSTGTKSQQAGSFFLRESLITNIFIHYLFPYGLPLIYIGISWQTRRRRQNPG